MKKTFSLLLCLVLVISACLVSAAEGEEKYYALKSLRASAELMGADITLTLDAIGAATLSEGGYSYNGSYSKTDEGFTFAIVPMEGYYIAFAGYLQDGMLVCENMVSDGVDYIFKAPENSVAGDYVLSDLDMPASSVGYSGDIYSALFNADGTCTVVGIDGTYTETADGFTVTLSDGSNSFDYTGVESDGVLLFANFLGSGADWKFVPAEKPVVRTVEEVLASESAAIYADITIAGYENVITIQLCPDEAPLTVENFVTLAKSGFYDGLTFHRIMEGFMMQGGDPLGNGTGGSENTIKGEFSANGVTNPLSHVRGAVSMARSSDMNSASSQFFIVHADSTFLDGNYAVFGYVVSGLDVVDAVCTSAEPTDSNGTIPAEQQPVITSIVIREA